jgi:hypothetical protein
LQRYNLILRNAAEWNTNVERGWNKVDMAKNVPEEFTSKTTRKIEVSNGKFLTSKQQNSVFQIPRHFVYFIR